MREIKENDIQNYNLPNSTIDLQTPTTAAPIIEEVTLHNFRNNQLRSYALSHNNTVITGANGSGKTTILEAISLLMPGKGLRAQHLGEVTRTGGDGGGNGWEAGFILDPGRLEGLEQLKCSFTPGGSKSLRDGAGQAVDGAQLLAGLRILWLSPEHENIFQEGAQPRRNYVDRMVYSIFPEHAVNFRHYARLLKSRLHILKHDPQQWRWLDTIEQQLAVYAFKLAGYRLFTLELLNQGAKRNSKKNFAFSSDIQAQGDVEALLMAGSEGIGIMVVPGDEEELGTAAARFKDNFGWEIAGGVVPTECGATIEAIAAGYGRSRGADERSGRSNFGAQRTKYQISLVNSQGKKDIAKCSTGEQKIVLASVFLTNAGLIASLPRPPNLVFLLDDIFAHLDQQHQLSLAGFLAGINGQVLITSCQGVDEEFIAALGGGGVVAL